MSTTEIIALKDAEIERKNLVIEKKKTTIKALEAEKNALAFRLRQLEKMLFGSKSEKQKRTEDDPQQLNLFVEPESTDSNDKENKKVELEQITYSRKKQSKKHVGRNPFPDHLPVKEVRIMPNGDTSQMTLIKEVITQTLEYTPANLHIKKVIRPVYVKKDKENGKETIVSASLPSRPLPKAIAEASLLSYILMSKFIDHLPFYRLTKMFKRDFDWEVSPSTINDWFKGVCTLLEPLYNKLKEKILESDYIQIDESPIKVLESKKKKQSHQGYQWVYHSPENRMVFFHYRRGRGTQGLKEVLVDYKGYVQCDGYSAYDRLAKIYPVVRLLGCLAHVRRKYHEALGSDSQRAQKALNIFAKIYKADQHTAIQEDKTQYRLTHIKPLLDELRAWVDEESIKVLPKSPIGKAMTYTVNQWSKIENILKDGRFKLDNNLIENKIRPLALGRKNYLFAGTHASAQRIAMMYSFFGTCAAQGINPHDWLLDTLNKIADTPINQIETLLPGYQNSNES